MLKRICSVLSEWIQHHGQLPHSLNLEALSDFLHLSDYWGFEIDSVCSFLLCHPQIKHFYPRWSQEISTTLVSLANMFEFGVKQVLQSVIEIYKFSFSIQISTGSSSRLAFKAASIVHACCRSFSSSNRCRRSRQMKIFRPAYRCYYIRLLQFTLDHWAPSVTQWRDNIKAIF